MPKPQFQDILPPDGRSIKKIPIPERDRTRPREMREAIREPAPEMDMVRPRAPRQAGDIRPTPRPTPPPVQPRQRPPEPEERDYEEITPEATVVPKMRSSRRKKWPIILSIISVLVIVALIYFFIPQVTGANIVLTPRGQTVSVDSTFLASKDPSSELPYQVADYEKDGKLTVPAGAQEFAQTKATGVIRIFNNFSETEQKLVANTRFATPKGLIFRIDKAVTVPGKTGSTPGSVDATVTADQIGADYNVGLTDFSIPRFKDDPKYTKIFARSKTPIDGGFSGNRKKVDPAQVSDAREKIHNELILNLIKQMQQNIPENFTFPKNAYYIEFQSLPDTQVDGGVQLTERATFHGLMFKRTDLAKIIATKVKGDTDGNTDLSSTASLVFSSKAGTSTKPWASDSFTFNLTGTTTLVSAIDTDKLKNELKGKPRKSLNAILAGYPGVAQAEVVMRPFWKQSFPDTPSDIMITIASSSLPK